MGTTIGRELGVERRCEDTTVADEHRIVAPTAQDLDVITETNDPGRTNEHPGHGRGSAQGFRELDRCDRWSIDHDVELRLARRQH